MSGNGREETGGFNVIRNPYGACNKDSKNKQVSEHQHILVSSQELVARISATKTTFGSTSESRQFY